MPTLALIALSVAAFAPQHGSSTWTVGVPGTAQFTQIQPAINAAAPGDVILVGPGSFNPFLLDKGLTIVGAGNAPGPSATSIGLGYLQPSSRVMAVPAGQRVVLVDFVINQLRIESCVDTVALVGLLAGFVDVASSADLRLQRVDARIRAETDVGRIESAQCTRIETEWGWPVISYGFPHDPVGSILVTNPRIIGGPAYGPSPPCFGAPYFFIDAGAALHVVANELIVAGTAQDYLVGGPNNQLFCYTTFGAPGVIVVGGTARTSGVHIATSDPSTFPMPVVAAVHVQPPRDDPSLELLGTPRPGSALQLVVHGEPGDWARIELGRGPVVVPLPGSPVPRLISPGRAFSLGAIPTSGSASLPVQIPLGTEPGAVFWVQASAVDPSGQGRATNSIPIVVRSPTRTGLLQRP